MAEVIDWQVVEDEGFSHFLWKRKLFDTVSYWLLKKSSNGDSAGMAKSPHFIDLGNKKAVFNKHGNSFGPFWK